MKIICLIPTYNTPIEQLEECIMSLMNQSRSIHKVVVLDDGSEIPVTDSVFNTLPFHGIKHMVVERSDTNIGTASTLNRGHKIATEEGYDWVMIHGASDISHPDRVKKQVAYLEAHPETDVLSTGLSAFKGSKHNQIFSFVYNFC